MNSEFWINELTGQEMENMMILSNLLKGKDPLRQVHEDIAPNTIVITYDYGIEKRGNFYSMDTFGNIEAISRWFYENQVQVETTYDQMVMIFDALGKKSFPSRYYLMRYVCSLPVALKGTLEMEKVNPLPDYDKLLMEGLKDAKKYSQREIKVLFDNETFQEDMKEGIYIFKKEGVPMGYAMIKYTTRKYAEISNLWVKREFRSKGYSNEMLKMIIRELKQLNLCALVTLKNDNFGLIRLFEQENFELKAIMSREKL
ncbi:MAG: hypothetical protein AVO33_03720 [delta proteobacterium ML8_F1]|nr:MAG: hypothetical protein AVO33_03720 [delta proteobacterium ML8_F1]